MIIMHRTAEHIDGAEELAVDLIHRKSPEQAELLSQYFLLLDFYRQEHGQPRTPADLDAESAMIEEKLPGAILVVAAWNRLANTILYSGTDGSFTPSALTLIFPNTN